MKAAISGCIQNPQRISPRPLSLPFLLPPCLSSLLSSSGNTESPRWPATVPVSNCALITWKCLEKMGFIAKMCKNLTFGVVFTRFSKACSMNIVGFPEQGRMYGNFANIYFLNTALFHPYAVSHGCFTLG